MLAELGKGMAVLLAQPAPAKGATRVVDAPNKQHDTGALGKSADDAVADLEAELNKMTPEARALALIKISQQMPEPNHRNR